MTRTRGRRVGIGVGALAALVLVLGIAVPSAAGRPAGERSASATKPKFTVGYVSPCECNVTIHALSQGLAAEVKRQGGKLTLLDARFNYAQINSYITSLINQKVNYLVVYGLYDVIRARLDEAKAAGIPIFAHDSVLAPSSTEDFKPITFQVIADRAAHAQAAVNFIARRNANANILGFGLCSNPPTINYLFQSFRAAVSLRPAMKIVDTVCNKTDDVAGALPVGQDALQRNPQTNAIFAYNDPTAIGASRAATALGIRDKLIITGGNAGPDGVEAIKNGTIDATWDTKAVETGQVLGKAIELYRQKKLRPGWTSIHFQLFTKANIGKFVPWETRLKQIAAGKYLGPPLPLKKGAKA